MDEDWAPSYFLDIEVVMLLKLEFFKEMAVLTVSTGGFRTEVRGNHGVGSTFLGDRLDRLLALPSFKRVNVSLLFADEEVWVRNGDAKEAVLDFLAREEELTRVLFSSTQRVR